MQASTDLYRIETSNRLSEWLLRVVDLGIIGVIFIAPLFMGGRGPIGKFVFVAFVCLSVVAWSFRQCLKKRASWKWSGVE